MPSAVRLNALLQRNKNSLDFVRFAAAIAVIFSHSYIFSLGAAAQGSDPVYTLTAGNFTAGQLAVAAFFAISGFLVTASLERSRSAIIYLKARFLRIYPALIILVLFTIFVLGPLVTTLSLADYLRSAQTYAYFQVLLLADVVSRALPGVFTHNAYPSLLNASLWTLFWEVLYYVIILILWLARSLRRSVVVVLWVVTLAVSFLLGRVDLSRYVVSGPLLHPLWAIFTAYNTYNFFTLGSYFFSGTVFYLFRDKMVMKPWLLLVATGTLIVSLITQQGITLWVPTFGMYALFYAASSQSSPLNGFGRYGDYSYGLYIYAPLVQQAVVYLFGGTMQPMVNFVLSAPITFVFAAVSWHLVEKPALKLKDRVWVRRQKDTVPVLQVRESEET